MTEEHLASLLSSAQAKKDGEGWHVAADGRHVTLYAAANGASLNVGRVEALRRDGALLQARTVKGEVFLLALEDVFAAAVEAAPTGARKAGFV